MKKLTKAMILALVSYLVLEEPRFCIEVMRILNDTLKDVKKSKADTTKEVLTKES